jgi:hypothetical protein
VRYTASFGDRALERRHRRALRKEIGTKDLDHRINICVRDILPAVGDHSMLAR